MFQEQPGEAFNQLTPQLAYLRHILDAHTTDPATAVCPVCGVPACPDWRFAYDQLAAAGQPMAEPARWRQLDQMR
jgi:hypothetical protein